MNPTDAALQGMVFDLTNQLSLRTRRFKTPLNNRPFPGFHLRITHGRAFSHVLHRPFVKLIDWCPLHGYPGLSNSIVSLTDKDT